MSSRYPAVGPNGKFALHTKTFSIPRKWRKAIALATDPEMSAQDIADAIGVTKQDVYRVLAAAKVFGWLDPVDRRVYRALNLSTCRKSSETLKASPIAGRPRNDSYP